ncbi:MAG: phosphoribosyltransferase domain-containing protein [Clostridium argentinense]|uniref:phosphoribosyltransferase domain-containing protein n=1 Tax=Clostridium butanoliproducens TaxID=2991837 RepID=UPI001D8E83B6|nr:phosphoribosyltransferase domain-containing protein [Clostridium butanoliproducens]MBS5823847.1 phosphoribosyltransferase domain-containing protein [Clostridium argentinense]MDU1348781.1 phosphoribosyltransferase domain-containing protein [Clostridium argentinense]
MDLHTKTYYKDCLKFNIQNKLKLDIEITENQYNIPYTALFSVAARKNPKRSFLFVSKVIGKHIPMSPYNLRLVGNILARDYFSKKNNLVDNNIETLVSDLIKLNTNFNNKISKDSLSILNEKLTLNKKTLFIGFAETATALGQAVASSFENGYYIQTTRDELVSLKSYCLFKEEHSHAVDHLMYPLKDDIFMNCDEIVLVDDEITTGKTSLNLIKELNKNLKCSNFSIISILDWRSDENLKLFNDVDNINLSSFSLIKGNFNCVKQGEIIEVKPIINVSNNSISSEDIVINHKENIEGFHRYSGRFGMAPCDWYNLYNEAEKISKIIKGKIDDSPSLCLGHEEFIFLPSLVACNLGDNVIFHSSTISPIYCDNSYDFYGIKNKIELDSLFNKSNKNFLYNIPRDTYKNLIYFTERPLDNKSKENLLKELKNLGILKVIFVSFNS